MEKSNISLSQPTIATLLINQVNSIQNQIEYHEKEIKRLKEQKQKKTVELISSVIDMFKELDSTVPDWRIHNEKVLNELKKQIEIITEKPMLVDHKTKPPLP